MTLSIHIPDEVREAMRIPRPQVEREIYRELALALYARWGLSMGMAARLGGLSKREFLDALAERGIPRHYADEDLAEDSAYADGGQQ